MVFIHLFVLSFLLLSKSNIYCGGDIDLGSGTPNDLNPVVFIMLIIVLSTVFIFNLDKYPAEAANVAKATKLLNELKKISNEKSYLAAVKAAKVLHTHKIIRDGYVVTYEDLKKIEQDSKDAVFLAKESKNEIKFAENILNEIKNPTWNKPANYNLQNYFYGDPAILNYISAFVIYFSFFMLIVYVYDLWGIPQRISKFLKAYKYKSILLIFILVNLLILFSKI
jgi:hypothetical protein